jgi:hypothetical protein
VEVNSAVQRRKAWGHVQERGGLPGVLPGMCVHQAPAGLSRVGCETLALAAFAAEARTGGPVYARIGELNVCIARANRSRMGWSGNWRLDVYDERRRVREYAMPSRKLCRSKDPEDRERYTRAAIAAIAAALYTACRVLRDDARQSGIMAALAALPLAKQGLVLRRMARAGIEQGCWHAHETEVRGEIARAEGEAL